MERTPKPRAPGLEAGESWVLARRRGSARRLPAGLPAASPGRPGTQGRVASAHLSAWARCPDWSPAELVSRGPGLLLAAPANMLHCWVTENKPVTWAEWAEALPGSSLSTSFCRVASCASPERPG